MKKRSKKKNLKILELTNFSAGVCGVWSRVKEESLRLAERGYQVKVFSSTATKGSEELACTAEKINGIEINRFPFKKLGGESFMSWDFRKEALKYSPDIIIAHNYRHLHTTTALKIAEALRKQNKSCRVFLVTHAPFARESTRSFIQNMIVALYDRIIGKRDINKFDKIITITKWENDYLQKLSVNRKKIAYIPNGIPEDFLSIPRLSKEKNKILFLGRISPIKNLEIAIRAMALLKNKKIIFEIVGPAEESYSDELHRLVKNLKLEDRVIFSSPIYDIKSKIAKLDSARIFVLPSKTEGMPQSLIEAMARGKIVIASDIVSIRDLIKDSKNGYLFNQGDEKDLARKINLALKNKSIGKSAKKSVKQLSWTRLINKIEALF